MGRKTDGPIHMKEVHLREQVLPVVTLDFRARLATEQDELQGPRVGVRPASRLLGPSHDGDEFRSAHRGLSDGHAHQCISGSPGGLQFLL